MYCASDKTKKKRKRKRKRKRARKSRKPTFVPDLENESGQEKAESRLLYCTGPRHYYYNTSIIAAASFTRNFQREEQRVELPSAHGAPDKRKHEDHHARCLSLGWLRPEKNAAKSVTVRGSLRPSWRRRSPTPPSKLLLSAALFFLVNKHGEFGPSSSSSSSPDAPRHRLN